jgi:hypothetical protein
VVIDGGVHAAIDTVAVLLFFGLPVPQVSVTLTQKLVVAVREPVLKLLEFVPTGSLVSGDVPRNHW